MMNIRLFFAFCTYSREIIEMFYHLKKKKKKALAFRRINSAWQFTPSLMTSTVFQGHRCVTIKTVICSLILFHCSLMVRGCYSHKKKKRSSTGCVTCLYLRDINNMIFLQFCTWMWVIGELALENTWAYSLHTKLFSSIILHTHMRMGLCACIT